MLSDPGTDGRMSEAMQGTVSPLVCLLCLQTLQMIWSEGIVCNNQGRTQDCSGLVRHQEAVVHKPEGRPGWPPSYRLVTFPWGAYKE